MKKAMNNSQLRAILFFLAPLIFTHIAYLAILSFCSLVIPVMTYATFVALSSLLLDPVYIGAILFIWTLFCLPIFMSKKLIRIE